MTAMYTVKQLIDGVAAGTIAREAAIAHCDVVLARPTTSENKRARWTRVKASLAAAKPITVAAAFSGMPEPKPAKKAAKAKAAPAAAPAGDDPMTMLARQMEAMTTAFLTLAKAKR